MSVLATKFTRNAPPAPILHELGFRDEQSGGMRHQKFISDAEELEEEEEWNQNMTVPTAAEPFYGPEPLESVYCNHIYYSGESSSKKEFIAIFFESQALEFTNYFSLRYSIEFDYTLAILHTNSLIETSFYAFPENEKSRSHSLSFPSLVSGGMPRVWRQLLRHVNPLGRLDAPWPRAGDFPQIQEKASPRLLETMKGVYEESLEDVAHVSIETENGKLLSGAYPARELEEAGVEEGGNFDIEVFECRDEVTFQVKKRRKKRLSKQEQLIIAQEIESFFGEDLETEVAPG